MNDPNYRNKIPFVEEESSRQEEEYREMPCTLDDE